MRKLLVIVDMQNDFLTGTLANTEGQKIVQPMADYIRNFDGDIVATKDTHFGDYLNTQEGKKLPVVHCVTDTEGWEITKEIVDAFRDKKACPRIFHKSAFGSTDLAQYVNTFRYDIVELCGVCTDICVISNAMLIKAYAPETTVKVLKNLCAGVTPESHETALKAMEACQIEIV